MTAKICILTSGIGARLQPFTNYFNKVLLPYDGAPVLDNILSKLPDLPIVVVVGHKKEQVVEYAHTKYGYSNVTVVEVDDFSSPESGPGYSLSKAQKYLQCPFYLVCGDCIFDGEIPSITRDWLGVAKTEEPENYCTVSINEDNKVTTLWNKKTYGTNDAFIGIAGIADYKTFWKELEDNKNLYKSYELVSAWAKPESYSELYAKEFNWVDQGTSEQFLSHRTSRYAKYPQYINELTYVHKDMYDAFDLVTKITDSKEKNQRRVDRGRHLAKFGLVNKEFSIKDYSASYYYTPGTNLYESPNLNFGQLLDWLDEKFLKNSSRFVTLVESELDEFYWGKSRKRISLLPEQTQDKTRFRRLGVIRLRLQENLNGECLQGHFAQVWHGDLNFSNIILGEDTKFPTFTTIDWRDCFTENTGMYGDLYYDLAKMYAGLVYPLADVDLKVDLVELKQDFEKWLVKNDLNLCKVKHLAGLVFINIAPLYMDQELRDTFIDLAYEYTK